MQLKEYKKILDKEMRKFIYAKIKDINKLSPNKRIESMIEYIYDIILSGGKRIRPYLVYITYKAFGGKSEKDIVVLSSAFEYFHNFALIHDDFMDNGTKRHGIQTSHEKFKALYSHGDKKHLGASQAILLGDMLFNRSSQIINGKYNFESKSLDDAIKTYLQMIDEVILGQMIDIDLMGCKKTDEKTIEAKNHLKTASYTFIMPIQAGAQLANIDHITLKKLNKLGKFLGNAYQIRDDLSDIITTKSDKTLFSDVQEGQHTFITDYIFKKGTTQQKALLKKYLGQKLSASDRKKLTEMFKDSGAIEHSYSMINELCNKSEQLLEKIKFTNEEYKIYFKELITLIRNI